MSDVVKNIPLELYLLIAAECDSVTLLHLSLTCKPLYCLFRNNLKLWQNCYRRDWCWRSAPASCNLAEQSGFHECVIHLAAVERRWLSRSPLKEVFYRHSLISDTQLLEQTPVIDEENVLTNVHVQWNDAIVAQYSSKVFIYYHLSPHLTSSPSDEDEADGHKDEESVQIFDQVMGTSQSKNHLVFYNQLDQGITLQVLPRLLYETLPPVSLNTLPAFEIFRGGASHIRSISFAGDDIVLHSSPETNLLFVLNPLAHRLEGPFQVQEYACLKDMPQIIVTLHSNWQLFHLAAWDMSQPEFRNRNCFYIPISEAEQEYNLSLIYADSQCILIAGVWGESTQETEEGLVLIFFTLDTTPIPADESKQWRIKRSWQRLFNDIKDWHFVAERFTDLSWVVLGTGAGRVWVLDERDGRILGRGDVFRPVLKGPNSSPYSIQKETAISSIKRVTRNGLVVWNAYMEVAMIEIIPTCPTPNNNFVKYAVKVRWRDSPDQRRIWKGWSGISPHLDRLAMPRLNGAFSVSQF